MSIQEDNIRVNIDYINELKTQFSNLIFQRIENTCGVFVTNPENKSFANDPRIVTETVAKHIFRQNIWPWTGDSSCKKLHYFTLGEDTKDIYKFDDPDNLQPNENYAVQNVGHATQIIYLPNCTILTDPIFNSMLWVIYDEKTESHPKICNLPKIDVVLISHNHRDHTDEASLRKILLHHNEKGWNAPKAFVPMGDKKLFESFGFEVVIEVEWFTKISLVKENGNTTDLICIPADHRSGRFLSDHHKSLVIGWVISDDEGDIIFKFSGDTRPLTDENQNAVDGVLWNEIANKANNKGKPYKDMFIPDIICFEPSGPNYTRCDMSVTHQSASYSALLKFVEAQNIAHFGNRNVMEVLEKVQTVMMHQNKFELGPDRFNEGLFVVKKLILLLEKDHEELEKELAKEESKLKLNLDKNALKKLTFLSRPLISVLPAHTSLIVHAKNFIIQEIFEITPKLQGLDSAKVNEILIKYLKINKKFLKIGERMSPKQLKTLQFDIELVKKYITKEKF
ncbi:hypothetical protein JTE90_014388 [Oedothorax gibbosus]|uniref:Metallo-beta-lactamase domain-containing protein n=1 Tax=Oedothorax gibbosus TaxID=931172 RepID=A0AAV6V4D3_9ARAC|nr:hypothetical protein JTE90_014388 [Oedothorax gibbosus]